MNTYYATLELDPQSHQWMADIEGLPVHTWGRTLAKVKGYAHEASHASRCQRRGCTRAAGFPYAPAASGRPRCDRPGRGTRSAAETAAARAAEARAVAREGIGTRRPLIDARRRRGPRGLSSKGAATPRRLTSTIGGQGEGWSHDPELQHGVGTTRLVPEANVISSFRLVVSGSIPGLLIFRLADTLLESGRPSTGPALPARSAR